MTSTHTTLRYFCDTDLSFRLESVDARGSAEFATAYADVYPGSGACSIEVAGGVAAFAGVSSPLSQSFAVGLRGDVSAEDFGTLEEFFLSRRTPAVFEVSPYAHPSLFEHLGARCYRAVEHTNVLILPLSAVPEAPASNVVVREAGPEDEEAWVRAISRGFAETDDMLELMESIARVSFRSRGAHRFVAEIDGTAVAGGSLGIRDRVAALAGAATLPEHRRRGAQNALYAYRLRFALEHGCEIAMVSTAPGSGSQRNAERRGFRVVYTRTKWQKD